MNDNELQSIYQHVVQPTNDQNENKIIRRQKLISIVEHLPDYELKSAIHLFDTTRYSKGLNKGSLLSPFLQNKALSFINLLLYKSGQNSDSLTQRTLSQHKRKQSQHILKVRAAARRPLLADSQSLKASILALIMKTKRQYTTQFISMTTQVLQINQMSFQSTVQATQSILGFLTGEDLPITHQAITNWNKEISNLHINQVLSQSRLSNFFTIGMMEVTFGKLSNASGFSQKEHSANLLYLAWDLHDGYDKSDKDKPMGVRSDYIRVLYEERFKYELTKYQQPIWSRWLYELVCAKQYLERRNIHIQFAEWFLSLKLLVRFGKQFYEPIVKFLTGYDPELKISIQNSLSINLPPGRHAHQMPDFIVRKTIKLRNIVEDPYLFFEKELLENINLLEDHQLNELILDLEHGTKKALELHQKWLDCWLHLPLSICHLGGKYGREFA
ncbi:hypothetical protein C2G38_2202146 [Gigaspora rosea]|uniref:Uncharacterized protein n=1 Tax=Gigaspora rosea TaxID=44941 RepID=A0A397URE0_9GLOM|nr:hypothetical protein C2G38_2202146 [Gigaspora rosea]